MARLWKKLWPAQEGDDLAEYALLLVLIAVTAIAAQGAFTSSLVSLYSSASHRVKAATQHVRFTDSISDSTSSFSTSFSRKEKVDPTDRTPAAVRIQKP